jgi:hypothetical protein
MASVSIPADEPTPAEPAPAANVVMEDEVNVARLVVIRMGIRGILSSEGRRGTTPRTGRHSRHVEIGSKAGTGIRTAARESARLHFAPRVLSV